MTDRALPGTIVIALTLVTATAFRPAPEPLDERIVYVEALGWREARDVAPPLPDSVKDGDRVGWVTPPEPAPAPSPLATGRKMSLNLASARQLESLPGIGPKLAERIVSGRPYASVDELDRISGIGPATLRKLRPLLSP